MSELRAGENGCPIDPDSARRADSARIDHYEFLLAQVPWLTRENAEKDRNIALLEQENRTLRARIDELERRRMRVPAGGDER